MLNINDYPIYRENLTQLLHEKAFKSISKQDIIQCMKWIIKKPNKEYLESNSVLSIIFDFCLFNYLPYLKKSIIPNLLKTPTFSEIQKILLDKMKTPQFNLMLIKDKKEQNVLEIDEILTGKTKFLIDMGIYKTIPLNTLIISNVLDFSNFIMTTGAPIPIVNWQPLLSKIGTKYDIQNNGYSTFSYKIKMNFIGTILNLTLETENLKNLKYQ